jgi:hypothetical protein
LLICACFDKRLQLVEPSKSSHFVVQVNQKQKTTQDQLRSG